MHWVLHYTSLVTYHVQYHTHAPGALFAPYLCLSSSKRVGKRVAFFPQQFLNTLTDEMDECVLGCVMFVFHSPSN